MTRLHVPVHVRWGDLDAFGHVNNAAIVRLLEEARVRAFWKHEDPARNTPAALFDERVRVGEHGPFFTVIAKHEIEYLAPIPYQQEPLDVQLWFSRFGGASCDICYEVSGSVQGEPTLFVRALSAVVLVRQDTLRPAKMPPEMRAAWEPYAEEPVRFARR